MTNEMTQRVKACDIEVWWPECHPRYPKERQDSPKLSSDLQRTVIAHVYVHVTSAPPTHTNNEYIWKLEKNKEISWKHIWGRKLKSPDLYLCKIALISEGCHPFHRHLSLPLSASLVFTPLFFVFHAKSKFVLLQLGRVKLCSTIFPL